MAHRPTTVGDPAPPLSFVDARGEAWRLGDQPGPVVLVFHRHIH